MSHRLLATTCVLALLPCGAAWAEPIGVLRPPGFDEARKLALAEVSDPAARKSAEALWDRTLEIELLDRVAATLAAADPEARRLLDSARDSASPAPTSVPAILRDSSKSAFFRNNLALAYAKEIATRRVHEEASDTLRAITPELTVDPATYYFFRAVAEHKLHKKDDSLRSIDRLLTGVADVPERYRRVAMLMAAEMRQWKDKDLGYIARLMDDLVRRFDLARGGDLNIRQQEEVIALLDKIITNLERRHPRGDNPTPPGPPGDRRTVQPRRPADREYDEGPGGPGFAPERRFRADMKVWGNLPEKEKVRALEQYYRELPAHYREAIEEYARISARGK